MKTIKSKIFLLLLLTTMSALGLSSCTNLSKTGLATTATTSAVSLATGSSPLVAGAVGVVGVATDYVVNEETASNILESTLQALPESERSAYLKSINLWNSLKDLGYYAIIAGFLLLILPYLVGYLMPTRRRKKLESLVFNNPTIRSDDLK